DELVPVNVLGAMVASEIEQQVATAKRYPRSVAVFKRKALELATSSEEIAASCFYTLPKRRGADKVITGPSVRLAAICAVCWGNCRFAGRLIADDGKFVTAQGVSHDLESNTAGSIEVRRRVTTKEGKRFSDDMVAVTSNAACSIAKREA